MAFGIKNATIAYQVARINARLNQTTDLCAGPVEETMLTQAALIATEQKSLAPIDPDSEMPGALKESVRVEKGTPKPKKAIVINIKAGGAKTRKQGKAAKPYDYGRAVEFGTQDMKAQPFFFPIWRARKKDARAAVRKAVKQAVSQVFK
jgi:HK97 gp10 family phage protein